MARLVHPTAGTVVQIEGDLESAYRAAGWLDADSSQRSEATSGKPQSDSPDESWSVKRLRAYAAEHGVELGKVTKKDAILSVIVTATAGDESEDESIGASDDVSDESDSDGDSDDSEPTE